eukprot:13859341-Alexandrium_andersonii.AAC.1
MPPPSQTDPFQNLNLSPRCDRDSHKPGPQHLAFVEDWRAFTNPREKLFQRAITKGILKGRTIPPGADRIVVEGVVMVVDKFGNTVP